MLKEMKKLLLVELRYSDHHVFLCNKFVFTSFYKQNSNPETQTEIFHFVTAK